MTDRDVINATFFAVMALAEKLTGQRLQFEMRCDDGMIRWVTSENDQIVDWVSPIKSKAEMERISSVLAQARRTDA